MAQNKKRKISSCFLCQKDNAAPDCDGVRPCSRCVRLGVPHMCIGIDLGVPATVPLHVEEPAPPPPPSEPVYEPMSDPFASRSKPTVVVPPSPSSEQSTPQPTVQTNSPFEDAQPTFQNNPHSMAEDLSSNNEISRRQNNLNIYFMKELKKLKGDQKRLDDEVLHLKLENSNLAARLKTSQWQVMRLMEYFSQLQMTEPQASVNGHLNPQRPLRALDTVPAVTATSSSTSPKPLPTGANTSVKGRLEQPMVVYDLSKSTATVLTANTTFCQMIGYDLNEMIGMPWTEFIPQEAARRTMNTILQQKNISSVIKLEQVYRHRTGGLFVTHDTHTILFGNDGMPTSDFVTLSFPESDAANPASPTRFSPSTMRLLADSNEPHLSPSSIQPLMSSSPMVETPSEDELDDSPAVIRPTPPHPAKPATRNGTHRSRLTPQGAAAKKPRRGNRKVGGATSPLGATASPIKLRDSIPKASVSVLDDDEDEGPHVQQIPFDEVLANTSRKRPQPVEGPTSIFQMPAPTTFSPAPSPFPPMSSPFSPAPNISSAAPGQPAPAQYGPAAMPAFTPTTASPPFSFEDTPSPTSSSPSSSLSSSHLFRASPPTSFYTPPFAATATPGTASTTIPSPHLGQSSSPLPYGGPHLAPISAPDLTGVEEALGDLDLDPSNWNVDEDFLNSLLAPQQNNLHPTNGGSAPGDSPGL